MGIDDPSERVHPCNLATLRSAARCKREGPPIINHQSSIVNPSITDRQSAVIHPPSHRYEDSPIEASGYFRGFAASSVRTRARLNTRGRVNQSLDLSPPRRALSAEAQDKNIGQRRRGATLTLHVYSLPAFTAAASVWLGTWARSRLSGAGGRAWCYVIHSSMT